MGDSRILGWLRAISNDLRIKSDISDLGVIKKDIRGFEMVINMIAVKRNIEGF